MKIINCPLNGPCNAQEFVCGGEVKSRPVEGETDIRAWVDYVFLEENLAGVVQEWWCHVASGYWFIAERDTTNDTFLCTYPSQDLINRPVKTGSDS